MSSDAIAHVAYHYFNQDHMFEGFGDVIIADITAWTEKKSFFAEIVPRILYPLYGKIIM